MNDEAPHGESLRGRVDGLVDLPPAQAVRDLERLLDDLEHELERVERDTHGSDPT